MPIFSIDAESCVNCGKCVKICPLDVLREGKTTPEIVYREDCQSCFLCIIYCPKHAIDHRGYRTGTGYARALLKKQREGAACAGLSPETCTRSVWHLPPVPRTQETSTISSI